VTIAYFPYFEDYTVNRLKEQALPPSLRLFAGRHEIVKYTVTEIFSLDQLPEIGAVAPHPPCRAPSPAKRRGRRLICFAFSRFFQREKVAEGRMREVWKGCKGKRPLCHIFPYVFTLKLKLRIQCAVNETGLFFK
jgi:hypothetical protein